MSVDWDAPVRLAILDEFLVLQEWSGLLDYALSHSEDFTDTAIIDPTGVHCVAPDFRRSRVVFDLGSYRELFAERILTHLPHVLWQLDEPEFDVREVEIQLTATNDGEFFRIHNDNRSEEVSSRVLTFVYYFYREPKAFAGGELRVFNDQADEQEAFSGPHRIAYPMQNQIVVFPSNVLHEILPVECPSGDFADSRFTVNGWLHR
jgi:SM-20-related protein